MKVVTRGLALTALAMSLSACARSPDDIKPANIDARQYAYLSCPQLAQYRVTLTTAYNDAADKQETARGEDAVGMIALGIPIGSATHKWTAWQVGDLKGRLAAVQQLQTADNCDQREAAVDKQ